MKLSILIATVFLFLFGCSSSISPLPLTDHDWQVERIIVDDSIILIDGEDHPTLSFDLDTIFNGQTMCNSISGYYHTTPSGGISMSIDAISTAFCPDNTVEGIFIEQIGLSHSYKIVGDTLQFRDEEARALIVLSAIDKKVNNN